MCRWISSFVSGVSYFIHTIAEDDKITLDSIMSENWSNWYDELTFSFSLFLEWLALMYLLRNVLSNSVIIHVPKCSTGNLTL